jgi:hypothetical protein
MYDASNQLPEVAQNRLHRSSQLLGAASVAIKKASASSWVAWPAQRQQALAGGNKVG